MSSEIDWSASAPPSFGKDAERRPKYSGSSSMGRRCCWDTELERRPYGQGRGEVGMLIAVVRVSRVVVSLETSSSSGSLSS